MAAEPERAMSPPQQLPPQQLPPQQMQLQLRNPFVLRVGQVMTGFGIGCGLGIGVGRPINLGALPGVGQALSGSGGLTRSFGGVGHQVQRLIKIVGIKNLEAGVGCGVGIGHGFGAGIALKPGVTQQLMLFIQHGLHMLAGHLRVPSAQPSADYSSARNANIVVTSQPASPLLQSDQDFTGSEVGSSSQFTATERTQNLFETKPMDSEIEALRSENEILRTLLRHQKLIDDLKEDNAAVFRALNLIPNASLKVGQGDSVHETMNKLSVACFECRRKARRRW